MHFAAHVTQKLSVEHGGDRVGDVVEVAAVERCHADASGVDRIDRILIAQPANLLGGEPRIREHAALLDHEVEVGARYPCLEFLDQLPVNSFEKIREFFEKMPKLYHKIEYKNELGNDRSIELKNLKDFFMWR